MKRALLLLLAVVVVAGLTGCIARHGRRPWACMGGSCAQAPENCASCDVSCEPTCEPSCESCRRMRRVREVVVAPEAPPGPPTGAVTYPYYTTRGPRDFLAKNPPSIGP